MKFYKKIALFAITFLIFHTNISADAPVYLDFKYILNQSDAGKKAQQSLKNKLDGGIKKIQAKEAQERESKDSSDGRKL